MTQTYKTRDELAKALVARIDADGNEEYRRCEDGSYDDLERWVNQAWEGPTSDLESWVEAFYAAHDEAELN